MPKRKPVARLLTEGRNLRNPGRFKGRRGPVRTRPLGEPYATMSAAEKAQWREFAQSLPWLRAHHRTFLHLTCHLAARHEAGSLGLTGVRVLLSCLSKLGATPVDQPRIAADAGDDEDDPSEAFFRTGGRTQ